MAADLLLLLDRRDLNVRLEGRALRIDHPDSGLQRAPLGVLGMVVAYGAPSVSCDVWRALAERHIPAVLLPLRGRSDGAWLGSGLSLAIALRRRQHLLADTATGLTIARELVRFKLNQQQRLIDGLAASPFSPAGSRALSESLQSYQNRLSTATDTAALMGVEGAAAAAWYGWLSRHLEPHWQFQGRNRRPPRDPLNALLSLGYTLMAAEVLSAVQQEGLDPALGFLHGIYPGRESLVLDLMEPLRPGVDALVLSLLDEVLLPEHFHSDAKSGCRLKKTARGLFFAAWAGARASWPLALPADIGIEAVQEDWRTLDDDEENAGDERLRTQCRRMVRWLRMQLAQASENKDKKKKDNDDG